LVEIVFSWWLLSKQPQSHNNWSYSINAGTGSGGDLPSELPSFHLLGTLYVTGLRLLWGPDAGIIDLELA